MLKERAIYKPVGLSCGHLFCTPCVLQLLGKDTIFGTTAVLLAAAPADAPPCPCCWRTGVYKEGIELKLLAALIKDQRPEDWMRREAADALRLKAIKKEYVRQQELLLKAYRI